DAVEQVTSPPGLASMRHAAPFSVADVSDQETLTRGAQAGPTGSPQARRRVKSEPLNLPIRTDGSRGATGNTLRGGMVTASAGPAVASPHDHPADWGRGSGGNEKKRPRRRGWLIVLTVIVTLG